MKISLAPENADKQWLLDMTGGNTGLHADPRDVSFGSLVASGASVSRFNPGQEQADSVILVPDHNKLLLLRVIVDLLLGPFGCPWDKEQTHTSLTKHLIEEAYELVHEIESKNQKGVVEELGDVFLQPFMHTQIAEKAGTFTLEQSLSAITEKLIRRHPHVFSDARVADSEQVLKNWDQIKKKETGNQTTVSILGAVPVARPALSRALQISQRAARAGFEWPTKEDVLTKLHEEIAEYVEASANGTQEEIQSEIGDLLFTVVNLARWEKVDPEEALRRMISRFSHRFVLMEQSTDRDLADLSAEEWDALWVAAKQKLSENTSILG